MVVAVGSTLGEETVKVGSLMYITRWLEVATNQVQVW